MRTPIWLRQHFAALRALVVLTVLTGIAYPLVVLAIGQAPFLHDKANGSLVRNGDEVIGSSLIGQSFTDQDGAALPQYFQGRPSAAGDGYDTLASGASNLGPEDMVDTADRASLLSTVCGRSKKVGEREGVDGSRPFCTASGVGAVLSVIGPRDPDGDVSQPVRVVSVNETCPAAPFIATYRGVRVECAQPGTDYRIGRIIPIRGEAPDNPAVPADAVTAGASGLDPDISPAYAHLQIHRIATARHTTDEAITHLVTENTAGRTLGFLGDPHVNVLDLNTALDLNYPAPVAR